MDDRVRGERPRRDSGQLTGTVRRAAIGRETALDDRDVAVGGDPADDRHREAPSLTDLADSLVPIGADDRAHPLLALRDHDLERSETRLATRHGVEIDDHARATPVGRLRGRAREPAGTEVLEAFDETATDELEARLDQELLGERIADLNGWPL